jgi:phosphopantothenoylcysteine decarboxylase
VERLKQDGCHFVGPEVGDLACGYQGVGRLAPIEAIFAAWDGLRGAVDSN